MFGQLFNVIETTKPRHILNAIKSPSKAFSALKYHYNRIPEREFVEFLSKKWGFNSEMIDVAYQDLNGHRRLWDKLNHNLSTHSKSYGFQMTQDGPSLYLLIRLIKPTS